MLLQVLNSPPGAVDATSQAVDVTSQSVDVASQPADATSRPADGRNRREAARSSDFEQIVAEEKDEIYSYARYVLGSAEEAEDVAQESLIKLWHHHESLDGCVRGWLHRVVRNACFDRLRRRRTARRVLSDDEEAAQRAPAPSNTPAEQTETVHVQEAVRVAVGQIPEPYRSALVLRELLELSYREVAERLDLPVNTIKTHVHRGRRMLRERLVRRGWTADGASTGAEETG